MIQFPTGLIPDFLSLSEVAEFPNHIWTSEEGVEWRSTQSCVASGAKISLKWDKTTTDTCQGGCYPIEGAEESVNNLICQILEFWKLCRGTLIGFTIDDTHGLWGLVKGVDACYRDVYAPFNKWRFDSKPKISVDICGVYDISIDLIQMPECR